MRRGVPAIVARISRDLFLADLDLHRSRLIADVTPEFGEELYRGAVARGGRRERIGGSALFRSCRATEQSWSCSRRRSRDEASWSGVAAVLASLAATAAAQVPLSPSGAVDSREPPAIAFPRRALLFVGPRLAGGPAPGAATRPSSPASRPAPAETVTRPAPDAPGAAGSIPAASAGSDETATSRTEAASTEGGENKTAVSRPNARCGAPNGQLAAVGFSREPGERYPGNDVADTLNARELSRFTESTGPVPIARPMGPPLGYPRPPVFGPPGYYGPPPGYGPPPYPPPMMRPPY